MDKTQAKTLFYNHIPAAGSVDYAVVESAMRSNGEGRSALKFFHQLRRAGEIVTSINRESGALLVSRQQAGV